MRGTGKEKKMSDKIELTRAEIDALDKYSAKMREEMVKEILSKVKKTIDLAKELEHKRAEISQSYLGERIHQYAGSLCLTLINDFEDMERRLLDETNKV
jgi:hypothetical protein